MSERKISTAISARELHQSLIERWCRSCKNDTKITPTKVKFFNLNGVLEFTGVLAGVNAVDLIFSGHGGDIGVKESGWTRTNKQGWIKMSEKDYQNLLAPQDVLD